MLSKRYQMKFEADEQDAPQEEPSLSEVETDPQAQAEVDATEVEVDESEEIVYPDLADTETEQAAERMQEVHDEAVEVAEDALNDTSTLAVAMENLRVRMQAGTLHPQFIAANRALVIDVRARQGFGNPHSGLNLESIGTLEESARLVMESFGNTLKTIWQALVNMFMRMVGLIKRFLMEMFSRTKHEKERTKAYSKALLAQRAEIKKAGFKLNRFESAADYVNVSLAARVLVVNRVQPADYAAEFNRLCDLAPAGKSFEVTFGEAFAAKLDTAIALLTAGQDLTAAEEAPSPGLMATKGFTIGPSAPGVPPLPGMAYMTYPPYLSDFTIVQEIPMAPPANPMHSYDILQNWKTHVVANQDSENSGDLRYLSSAEIEGAGQAAIRFADTLSQYKNSFSVVEKIEKHLQEASKRFTKDAESIANSNPAALANINTIVGAMQSVMRNVEFSLREYPRRGHAVLFAWNNYLKAIYIKEKDLFEKEKAGPAPI